jgi:hypothetical protein
VGVVRTPDAEVATELTENGQEYVRHMWQRRCEAELVGSQVSISYGDDFRVATVGGEPAAVGSLLLERQEGQEPVTVVGATGSVLYDVEATRTVATPDQPVTRVPLRIRPGNRCDEHARGQATAPFMFRVIVRVGETTTPVLISPPTPVQVVATAALDEACR